MTKHSNKHVDEYVKPELVDFGSLVELTQATAIGGQEDGASKLDTPNHHSMPFLGGFPLPI